MYDVNLLSLLSLISAGVLMPAEARKCGSSCGLVKKFSIHHLSWLVHAVCVCVWERVLILVFTVRSGLFSWALVCCEYVPTFQLLINYSWYAVLMYCSFKLYFSKMLIKAVSVVWPNVILCLICIKMQLINYCNSIMYSSLKVTDCAIIIWCIPVLKLITSRVCVCVCVIPTVTDLLKQFGELFSSATIFPFLLSSRKAIEFDFLWCAFIM